jgi:hypothetical protein
MGGPNTKSFNFFPTIDLLTNSLINVHCENLVSIYEAAGKMIEL